MFGLDILGGLLTKAPTVPQWQDVNLGKQQSKAIGENIAALPQAEELASKTTAFNQQQITQMLNQAIPGWSQLAGNITGDISSMVKGEIPVDVQQAIQGSAAAQALTGGFGGSGLAGNLVARDLGLTSLGIMEKGISSAENWANLMNQFYSPGTFNMSSMFVSPQQQFQATMQNQEIQYQQQWLQNQLSSAHDWRNIVGQSMIQTDAQLAEMAASIVGKVGGAALGGAVG